MKSYTQYIKKSYPHYPKLNLESYTHTLNKVIHTIKNLLIFNEGF